jgi:hypothetical protein
MERAKCCDSLTSPLVESSENVPERTTFAGGGLRRARDGLGGATARRGIGARGGRALTLRLAAAVLEVNYRQGRRSCQWYRAKGAKGSAGASTSDLADRWQPSTPQLKIGIIVDPETLRRSL